MEPETLHSLKTDKTTMENELYLLPKLEDIPETTPTIEDIDYDILRVFYAAGF